MEGKTKASAKEYYALIMLNKVLSNKRAARSYQNSGYHPLVIDPIDNGTPTDTCIEILQEKMQEIDTQQLVICALESNYSYSGQPMCNAELFNFVCDNIKPFYMVAYSATPQSISATQEWMEQKKEQQTKAQTTLPRLLCVDFNEPHCFSVEAQIPNLSVRRSPGSNSPFSRRVSIF